MKAALSLLLHSLSSIQSDGINESIPENERLARLYVSSLLKFALTV